MKSHARTGPGIRAVLSCIIATGLILVGCSDKPPGPELTPKIIVGSRNFDESVIIANMYSAVLERAGLDVERKYNCGDHESGNHESDHHESGNRERCLEALDSGEIDLVPEYLGSLTGFLVEQVDPDTESTASSIAKETFAEVQSLVGPRNLIAYPYSPASDQNEFAVTKATADKYDLAKLSDLAEPSVRGRLVLGGSPECPAQPYCKPGLEETYGAVFQRFVTLDAAGQRTINAIADGTVDIGLVLSSDGSVAARDLIVLEDNLRLQAAENIFPLIRSDKASEEIKTQLGRVSQALTTEELRELNRRVGIDGENPTEVAEDFLEDKDLL